MTPTPASTIHALVNAPRCGLYRTTRDIEGVVAAGHLVYFHNHGDPGPGVYLPESWTHNRATFSRKGHTLGADQIATLAPLPAEGLYRVTTELSCCEERHRVYPREMLVQLGYDRLARPILFVPEWTSAGLVVPERGQALDPDRLSKLAPLVVAEAAPTPPAHLN